MDLATDRPLSDHIAGRSAACRRAGQRSGDRRRGCRENRRDFSRAHGRCSGGVRGDHSCRLAVGYADGTDSHREFRTSRNSSIPLRLAPNSKPHQTDRLVTGRPAHWRRSMGRARRGGDRPRSPTSRVTQTIVVGEEPGNIVWPDDVTIVVRTPTCLKRWPVADAFSGVTVCEAPCDQGLAEFSSGGRIVAERVPNSDCRFRDGRDGRLLGTLLMVRDCRPVVISPQGHYSAPVDVDDALVYVVEAEAGEQQTLTPREFARRFQWENDSPSGIS